MKAWPGGGCVSLRLVIQKIRENTAGSDTSTDNINLVPVDTVTICLFHLLSGFKFVQLPLDVTCKGGRGRVKGPRYVPLNTSSQSNPVSIKNTLDCGHMRQRREEIEESIATTVNYCHKICEQNMLVFAV